jgi:plastocyanin
VSWLAILLAAAVAAAAGPAPRKHHRVAPAQRLAKKAPVHKGLRIKRQAVAAPRPSASPVPVVLGASPTPTATPTVTATPTPTPVYPSRTKVILKEYSVQSSYITMKAGPLEFNVVNNGMDDHNLTVKGVDGAAVDAPADGQSYPLDVTLAPGTYTLYCSLPTHEALGMSTTLTVK